jgi:hypothetical protein
LADVAELGGNRDARNICFYGRRKNSNASGRFATAFAKLAAERTESRADGLLHE